jgi:hypothetical protein
METTNKWADGEDHMRKTHARNNDSENNQRRLNNLGSRQDRQKSRRGLGYKATDCTNVITTGHTDWRNDQCNEQNNDCWDNSRSGSRSGRQYHSPRMPDLLAIEQLNAPFYLHTYIDSKDNIKKASHLIKDCR